MELPFLLVHGAIVWKVVLAVFVVTCCGLVILFRRWNAPSWAREQLSWLDTDSPLDEGKAVIVARVVEGSATTVAQADTRRSVCDGLVLEHDGSRITLSGAVIVTHGARERSWWLRAPRDVPAALAPKRCRPSIARSVAIGDEVIVNGVARRVDEAEASYRRSGSSWEIGEGSVTVTLAAVDPRTQRMPLGMTKWIAGTVLLGLLGLFTMYCVGQHQVKKLEDDYACDPGAFALASAMPGARARALELLVRCTHVDSERSLERELQIAELAAMCPAGILLDAGRYDEALAAARRCDREREPWVLLYLGRYREIAVTADPTSFLGTTAAMAEGRWRDAAIGVEATASAATSEERATEWRCLARLFRTWAGDTLAESRGHESLYCRVTAALALPPEQRASALLATVGEEQHFTWSWHSRALASAYGGPLLAEYLDGFDLLTNDSYISAWNWIARFATPSSASPPRSIWAHESRLFMIALQRADIPAARQALQRARRAVPDHLHDGSLAMLLALFAGEPLPPSAERYEHPVVSRARAAAAGRIDSDHVDPGCRDRAQHAIEAMRAGNGRPVARLPRSCFFRMSTPAWMAAIPHVREHKDELAEMLRWRYDRFATYRYQPIQLMHIAWQRREIAKRLGDRAEAARWHAIHERHGAVLADRERAIALLLWTE